MIYLIGGLFVALLLATGVASCEHKTIVSLEASIEANKIEAKRILADQTAKVAAKEKSDKEFSIRLQGDYDASLKKLSDTNRAYVGKLRDPWNSGACARSETGPATGVFKDASTGAELSDALGKLLRSEADRADIAATYAAKCRELEMKGKP